MRVLVFPNDPWDQINRKAFLTAAPQCWSVPELWRPVSVRRAPRDFYLLKPIETAETRNYSECGLNPTVPNCPELATSQSRAATQSLNTGPGIHTGILDLYADGSRTSQFSTWPTDWISYWKPRPRSYGPLDASMSDYSLLSSAECWCIGRRAGDQVDTAQCEPVGH